MQCERNAWQESTRRVELDEFVLLLADQGDSNETILLFDLSLLLFCMTMACGGLRYRQSAMYLDNGNRKAHHKSEQSLDLQEKRAVKLR